MKRWQAAALGGAAIALGLASRRIHLGNLLWDKSLGDALYTVMVYFAIALLRPRWPPALLGGVALAFSIAIELFQLTGIPARMPRLLHLVFGTTFAVHDLACYVVGAALVTGAHALASGRLTAR